MAFLRMILWRKLRSCVNSLCASHTSIAVRAALVLCALFAAPSAGFSASPVLVQHVSHSSTQGNSTTTYDLRFGHVTTLGNCVVVKVATSIGTPTAADDKSNAYTQRLNATDANSNAITIFTAHIGTGGSQDITLTYASSTFVLAEATEYANVDSGCAIDGSNSGQGTSTAPSAGAIATTVDGDVIDSFVIQDGVSSPITSINANSGFALLSSDVYDSHASEWEVQNTHGSITPGFALSPSNHWFEAAIALKGGASGSVPTGGRVVHVEHLALPVNASFPNTIQFPCTQNNIVIAPIAEPAHDFTSFTDSNSNTYSRELEQSNGSSGIASVWDTGTSATCSTALTITVSKTGTDITGSTLVLFDIAGYNSIDVTAGTNGSQNVAGNQAGASPTPTQANDICIAAMAVNNSTVTGVTPGLFMASHNSPESSGWPNDQNNGWEVYYAPSAANFTNTWSDGTIPFANWADATACYKTTSTNNNGVPLLHILGVGVGD